MGLLDRFFGTDPPPSPPRLEGDVMYVAGPTGMVSTTDKQALTFHVDECRGFVPRERQRVQIDRVEGMAAKGLTLVADAPVFVAPAPRPPAASTKAVERGPASLDWEDIERCFGAPLGPLLRSLVELCFRLDPMSPADSLSPVFLLLDWIPPGAMDVDERRVDGMTPSIVWPFAATGADLEHFGFLMQPGDARPMEDRPVVFVAKDVPPAHVVAPNLRAFLGLVAFKGMAQLERGCTDSEMRKVRDECLDEAGARACMEALVTLPGVELPTRPMQVIRRARDVWFDDVAGAKPTAWPKPKDSYDALRFGWRRLADGDAHGALDAVAGLPAGIAIATRIRWRALYDLQDLDALRRSIDADLEELTRHRVPGDAAALEDVTFLIEESGATVSAAMRDALAMAFAVNAR